jgi:3-phenylpropionate/trans-cinnamate dioxygenase ferredoxin subunit
MTNVAESELDGFADVGAIDDFADSRPTLVPLGGRDVVIVRWRDEVFAFNNDCPHQGGPLCKARIVPLLTGGLDGEMRVEANKPLVACAWHGWEFDLRHGDAMWDPNYRLRTYAVRVAADRRVMVNVRRKADRAS